MVHLREFLSHLRAENVPSRFPMSQSMSNTSVRVCGPLLTVVFGTSVSHPQSFGLVRGWGAGGGGGGLPPSSVVCALECSLFSNALEDLEYSDS